MRFTSVAAATIGLAAVANAAAAEDRSVVVTAVADTFANVKQEVEDAIVQRGLVVDYTAHVGAMLARTAKDVGATRTVYGDAEALQFCSATLSRKTMEADPANIAFCPYVVFVYTLAGEPDTTYVGYRPLPSTGSTASRAATGEVNALLAAIVRAAAGGKN